MDFLATDEAASIHRVISRAVLAVLAGLLACPPALPHSAPEGRVKAAFIYNFLKFVEWPPDSMPPSAPILLCTLGEAPLGGALEEILKDRTVGERKLVIRHLAHAEAARTCHVLFVDQSETPRLNAIFAVLADASVLTIGESPSFLKAGGCIDLIIDRDRVRFSIALPAARSARLTISSRLLALALEVQR